MLSGHTHGGQVGADMFGTGGSLLGLLGVYDQGLFEEPGRRLYVHRGNWHTGLPPRMGIAAEITLFELEPGPAA
jgi:predicted MPP superfamily phosphohydrolase